MAEETSARLQSVLTQATRTLRFYTRRGLEKLMARPGFPEPAFAINRGRNRAWSEGDIRSYEAKHPELTSEAIKQQKVVAYAKANAASRRGRQ